MIGIHCLPEAKCGQHSDGWRSLMLLVRPLLAAALGLCPLLVLPILLGPVGRCGAENFDDIGGEKFTGVKRSGSVVRARSGIIEVNTGDKTPLTVLVGQDALNAAFGKHKDKIKRDVRFQCEVTGTADFGFLRKDHGVSFSTELDKQRTGVSEVAELSVFTVDDPSQLSLVDTQGSLDEEKPAAAKGGYFQVNGQINQLRKDGITVKTMVEQGKKTVPVSVKVRVAADAKVSLRVADYNLAKPGDSIEIEGYTFTKGKQEVPNTVLAETVKIALAKPIGSADKTKAVARAQPRAEKTADKKTAADDEEEMPASRASNASPAGAANDEEMTVDPSDPPAGKLIFRDNLEVDGDESAGPATGGKSSGLGPKPKVASGPDDAEPEN